MKPPIEPLSGNERLTVPAHLLTGRPGDHYILRVVGDSMLEDGISDGDYIICQRLADREAPQPGDTCVVRVGDDATIRRYYYEGDTVRLECCNSDSRERERKSIRIPSSEVKVQSVVVGLMRKFPRGGDL